MRDEDRTKGQLVNELMHLRRRVTELEKTEGEYRQVERALRNSQERLSLALKSSKAGTWDRDILADKATWDEDLHALFGLQSGSFSGRLEDFLGTVHPDDRDRVRGEMTAAMDGHAEYSTIYRVIWPDSSVHFLADRGKVYCDGAGQAVRMIGISLDVTEHKQTEEELGRYRDRLEELVEERTAELAWANEQLRRQVEERKLAEESLRQANETLHAIIAASPVAILALDREGRVTKWSPAAERIFGGNEQEMIGRFNPIVPEDKLDEFRADFRRVIGGEEFSKAREVRRQKKDGSLIDISLSTAPLRSAEGEITGAVAILEDITERKRTEEERLQLDKRLHQAQKAESLGRMAGSIAHHFNSLLSAVMGRLELALRDSHQAPKLGKHLTEAMKASQQAAQISRLMLTYLGHTVQRKEPCNVVDAVRESLLLLGPSLPQTVNVNAQLPYDTVVIEGDKMHIEQALTNLILNAGEAIGDGGGEITLAVHTTTAEKLCQFRLFPSGWEPAENSYVSISISDTGCGFDSAMMERIFDPFFSTKFTGRGLGLAVVLGIVRAHGGALAVESQSGLGSVFRVFLPLPVKQRRHPSQEPTVDFEALKESGLVLVVEDEPLVRELTEAMLKEFDYEVIVAGDGFEALEKFRERQDEVRLVLLDLTMPGMNGWETMVALRALRSDLPVILASGYDEAQVMRGNHAEQPQAFLHKPYHMKDLEAALGAAQNPLPAKNRGPL